MAIVKVNPPDFENAPAVVIDSDAPTNEQALREIDDWGFRHGFARTGEYWLRVMPLGGKRYFRGTCYRLTDEESEASKARVREVAEAAKRLSRPA